MVSVLAANLGASVSAHYRLESAIAGGKILQSWVKELRKLGVAITHLSFA